jgi:hypothetical protein
MRLPIRKCKVWLASIWFLGTGVIFVILFFQSVGGVYEPLTKDVWEWFLPNLMPTLSLIVGILALDAVGKVIQKQTVDRFFFRLTLGLSGCYLILMVVTILSLLRWPGPNEKIAFLKMSSLWLGPFQGLVTASLGVFFVNKAQPDDQQTAADKIPAPETARLASGNITP